MAKHLDSNNFSVDTVITLITAVVGVAVWAVSEVNGLNAKIEANSQAVSSLRAQVVTVKNFKAWQRNLADQNKTVNVPSFKGDRGK